MGKRICFSLQNNINKCKGNNRTDKLPFGYHSNDYFGQISVDTKTGR